MKLKKCIIKIYSLALITASCIASAETTVHADLQPDPVYSKGGSIVANVEYTFGASHSVTVTNRTAEKETVHVCYSIDICPNYPLVEKLDKGCVDIYIDANSSKSDVHMTRTTYKVGQSSWQYVCKINATTEVTGEEYGSHVDWQRFTVKPW